MVLTAGFYCDSWAHNVRKVRVVKYIVVYGHIKAADQKYCHNQKVTTSDENSKKQAFEQEVLETIEMIFGQDTVERRSWIYEEYAFSVDKKTTWER